MVKSLVIYGAVVIWDVSKKSKQKLLATEVCFLRVGYRKSIPEREGNKRISKNETHSSGLYLIVDPSKYLSTPHVKHGWIWGGLQMLYLKLATAVHAKDTI